ncbi:MAG: cell division protein SepF [Clostridiales bacterium]|nr:cell division protein SepF [Clostridiales bacterium]
MFKKLDRFEDVAGVADVLNEKRIVVLNLETCQPDISRRIIDFLYGVAYANNGELKRIAGRAYIITPYNVPLTGELLDEADSSSMGITF